MEAVVNTCYTRRKKKKEKHIFAYKTLLDIFLISETYFH